MGTGRRIRRLLRYSQRQQNKIVQEPTKWTRCLICGRILLLPQIQADIFSTLWIKVPKGKRTFKQWLYGIQQPYYYVCKRCLEVTI